MKHLFFVLLFMISAPALAEKIIIVTNVMNSTNQISRDQIQDYFFKRNRSWPDGKPVRFFDRQDNSHERAVFLKSHLHKSARQVDQFWIAQKFNTGDSAPIQVSTDTMTLNMVSRFPGGISYVKEGVSLPKNVKILEISE